MQFKFHKFLLINLLFVTSLHAQTYYVSAYHGNNNNSGVSENSAFETINKALSKNNVSTIVVLNGIYHEEITISNRNDIEIKVADDANVVLDGTKIIDADKWESANISGMPNIYRAEVNDEMWQLFVDDEEKIMARWPNATFDRNTNGNWIYDHTKWAVDTNNSPIGTVNNTISNGHGYSFSDSQNPINSSINGGMLVGNFGSFRSFALSITSDISGSSFTYYGSSIGGANRTKHRYYFIEGKLHLLNAENEWFYQEVNGKKYVYVWASSLADIKSKTVRGKVQSYAINIIDSDNISVSGIKFFATTLRIESSNQIVVKDNVFSYPNYSRRMLGITLPPLVTSIDQDLDSGKVMSKGSHSCEFRNNVFEYTDGEALIMAGNNHIIDNNYFHHIDWSCGSTQSIGLSIYCNNSNGIQFTKNTMHTTGASATLNLGNAPKILFNDISDTGYAQSDGSIVQHTKNSVAGSETAFNWLHDTGKYGFRFDAPVPTPCTAGEYGLAHHNVIWNIGDPTDNTGGIGMMIKGNNQQIYNNTVFNCLKTDILIVDENCTTTSGTTNTNSYTRNNLTDFIGGNRSAVANNVNDIPGSSLGRVTHNLSQWKDDFPQASTSNVNYDVTNFLLEKPVYHFFPNANNSQAQVVYDPFKVLENNKLYNFTPKSDQNDIINSGVDIETTMLFSNGEVDVNVTNSDDYQKINTPDLGAYERGQTYWRPGINFNPVLYPWEWPSDPLSIDINKLEKIKIYPNPVNNVLNINSQLLPEISIYNTLGQNISNYTITDNKIDVSSFNPGIYLLELKTKTSSRILKFIKQ